MLIECTIPGVRVIIGNKTNFQLSYIPCEKKTAQKAIKINVLSGSFTG